MMEQESIILLFSALSIGVSHTLIGPDHYIPFIILGKARKWSISKTLLITVICGLGHVGSSIIIGLIGIIFGVTLKDIINIEASRGSVAAWMMVAFGLFYFIWGFKKSISQKKHSHFHYHEDGTYHLHNHLHQSEHLHIHERKTFKELTPWILFTIFIFGPCEPFIPLFLYPAAENNMSDIVLVTLSFTSATLTTMAVMVFFSLRGLKYIPLVMLEKHMNSLAGITIMLCGLLIIFLE